MQCSNMIGWCLAAAVSFSAVPQTFGQGAWNGAWASLSSMPVSRHDVAVGEINGVLYVAGGCCGPGTAALQAYDTRTNVWSTNLAQPPATIAYLGTNGAVVNGILYVIGGNNSGTCTNANWAYNPTTNTWTQKAPMPTSRCHLGVAAIDGLIYAVGGTNTSGTFWYNNLEVYDPAANSWTIKTPMPTPRSNIGVAALKGNLYVVGGSNPAALATVEAYNPATNSWTTKAPLPAPRNALGVAVNKGLLYAVGGYSGSAFVNDVYSYDLATNAWTPRTPMTSARASFGCRAVDGAIYVMGGYNGPLELATTEALLTPDLPPACPADVFPTGGDGSVNIDDLVRVITSWGSCP